MSLDGENQVGFPKLQTPFVQADVKDPGNARQIALPWYRLLIALWNRTGGSQGNPNTSLQSGMILPFAGPVSAVPSGFALCDGTQYQTSALPNLFAAIGYTWGGSGLEFNVPDLRGRTLIGAGPVYALGAVGGGITNLTQGMLPPHSHGVTDPGHVHTITDPQHAHGQEVVNNGTAGVAGTQGASTANTTTVGTTANAATGITVDSAQTGISTQNTGNGDAVPTIPPYGVVNWIIKT